MSFIKKILNSIKDGTFIEKTIEKINVGIYIILSPMLNKNVKIKNNKVILLTFQGNYNCNPKYIAEYIIDNKIDFELVWVTKDLNNKNINQYPKELKLVRRGTLKFYKEFLSSKYIIDNANNFEYLKLKKRKEQILLQPWHGSMGFKKLETNKNKNWMNKAHKLDEITDYCIVNSEFEIDVFRNSFWPTTKMLKYGHPRNDILFNLNNEFEKYGNKIRKKYNISPSEKIALYAPTFRDDNSMDSYDLDFDFLHKALVKRFGGKWKIFVRFHYKLRNISVPKKYSKNIINVTDYSDIQELLCACDIGITDYSSWLCDFVLTRKPGFLYTADMDKYIDERGFYYPLETTPFKIAKTNDEMYENIINYNEKEYQKGVDNFLKDRGCFEDGHACEKLINKMIQLNKEKQ